MLRLEMFWVRFLRSRVFHVILVLVVYSLGVTLRRQELRKAGHGIGKKTSKNVVSAGDWF